ncbi:MAG TPA: PQQ-binding-like beta-propeller repeat protein [Armatimonadota bacterium]|jgi:alcohol dehydrogenase (cytochrome c)
MYNGDYGATRFSPLRQITTRNVVRLQRVARYKLPEITSFQSGPVVVGRTLYVTSALHTYAIDAVTGRLLWHNKYAATSMGLGTPVRGVAYASGRLFRGTPDGHLLALNARTGRVIWNVSMGDPKRGEYFTVAPIVWRGRGFIGTSGSDVGSIGRVIAFDTGNGRRLWSWAVVPSKGPGADTWSATNPRAGGGMYSSYALDPASGILYVPTGNPGPDFAGSYRPGKNLYTCSAVMLNTRTGAFLGYHQFVPHDVHDWDIAASPVLFTSRAGRRMVAVGGKDGYLYGLDRRLQTVRYKTSVTTHSNTAAPLTPEGTLFAPGTQGGVNWYGPAYSPRTNLLYVPAIDWPTLLKLAGGDTIDFHPGKPFLGSANMFGFSDPNKRQGWLTAVDADTGRVRWKYRSKQPMVAAVTPTAGGVVFTGDFLGNLLALDAATGRVLARKKVAGPVGGGIVTYTVNGRQYVAVSAGMKNDIMMTKTPMSAVDIFALR